uniref:WAP domain-containing protein n=1 Tax=Xenopus tropicalis TaxID=8364 RepID=A0A6I8RRM7_XENTR
MFCLTFSSGSKEHHGGDSNENHMENHSGKRGHCPVVPSGNNVTLDSCNTTCPGGKCCNVTCGMKCVNPIYITKKPKCYLLLVNDNNALQCCLWVYGWIKGLLIL